MGKEPKDVVDVRFNEARARAPEVPVFAYRYKIDKVSIDKVRMAVNFAISTRGNEKWWIEDDLWRDSQKRRRITLVCLWTVYVVFDVTMVLWMLWSALS